MISWQHWQNIWENINHGRNTDRCLSGYTKILYGNRRMAVLYAVLTFLQKKSKTGCFYRDCGCSASAADRLADAYGRGSDTSLDPLYGNRHFNHASISLADHGYYLENGGLLLYESISGGVAESFALELEPICCKILPLL